MAQKLWTKLGTGRAIARSMGVSFVTVSKAINGKTDSELARKIRTLAIKAYGAIVLPEK